MNGTGLMDNEIHERLVQWWAFGRRRGLSAVTLDVQGRVPGQRIGIAEDASPDRFASVGRPSIKGRRMAFFVLGIIGIYPFEKRPVLSLEVGIADMEEYMYSITHMIPTSITALAQ